MKQRNMLQTKEHDKSPETDLIKTKKSDLPDTEFKIIVLKVLTKVRKATHEQSESFNRNIKPTVSNRNHRAK